MNCPLCNAKMYIIEKQYTCKNILVGKRAHFVYYHELPQPAYDLRFGEFLLVVCHNRTFIYDQNEFTLLMSLNYGIEFSEDVENIAKNLMLLS